MKRHIKRGQVFWVNLGNRKGSEQGGNRLCVILQNNVGNHYAPTTIVAPLTTVTKKSTQPTHVELTTKLPQKSVALLEQITTIDNSRLYKYCTNLNGEDMENINSAIMVSLGVC